MYFAALATDYDETLADSGTVEAETVEALKAVKESGRKLILVTGRTVPDLQGVFSQLEIFDLVVAENGALLFDPATGEETPLADPPPAVFVRRLLGLGISPVAVGRTIVATREPNETAVLTAIRDLGLELQIIFNKGAVMVLPSNINKATGLRCALARLGLSPHNVVGIGDAENDHAFLIVCGFAVAVANAIPALKERADLVTKARGKGVVELAGLLTGDLRATGIAVPRVKLGLGTRDDGTPIALGSRETMLIVNSPGAGKAAIVINLVEQMRKREFQFCIVDPEGNYTGCQGAVVIGSAKRAPDLTEVVRQLETPEVSVVLNLTGIEPEDRPRFFARLVPEIAKLRAKSGRPHWIVVDEAHQLLPANSQATPITLPQVLPGTIAVTAHPEEVAPNFHKLISLAVAVGVDSRGLIDAFRDAKGHALFQGQSDASAPMYLWTPDSPLEMMHVEKPETRVSSFRATGRPDRRRSNSR